MSSLPGNRFLASPVGHGTMLFGAPRDGGGSHGETTGVAVKAFVVMELVAQAETTANNNAKAEVKAHLLYFERCGGYMQVVAMG